MRLALLTLFIIASYFASAKEKCAPVTQEDCANLTSEYEKYRECMEHRTKRSLDCDGDYDYEDSCDNCNCNTCNQCDSCSNCCSRCCPRSSCGSYSCCHQSCRAECKSNSCRTSCKKKCQDRGQDRIIATNGGGRTVIFGNNTVSNKAGLNHNITTVIHLNNFINNTNLINLPISDNKTVFNNIPNWSRHEGAVPHTAINNNNSVNKTVFNNIPNWKKHGGAVSHIATNNNNSVNKTVFNNIPNWKRQGSAAPLIAPNNNNKDEDNCCITVGPRQCVPQRDFPFVKCFHVKKKVCGSICIAPMLHSQMYIQCDRQSCQEKTFYVPQPQPNCAYQPNWPYVTCGNNQFPSCDGCYDDYVKREDVIKCSNFCYDDGFGAGPYYRQGPFYRPGYGHVPSCLQTGTCNGFEGYGVYDGEPVYPSTFPYAYPPSTYPWIIEDCENCTNSMSWDSANPNDPIMNNYPEVHWSNFTDTMLNIDSEVTQPRSERYAEIKIQSKKESAASNRSGVSYKNQ